MAGVLNKSTAGTHTTHEGESAIALCTKAMADYETATNRYAVVGALVLYLDFINLFLMMLRFMGQRRN